MAVRRFLVLIAAGILATAAAEKPRIFVTESGAPQLKAKGALQFAGGTSPQNLEVIKAFTEHCPAVTVTANRNKADFFVQLDHDPLSPTTPFSYGNKVAIFDKSEDLIYTTHTHLLGTAVKSACAAISEHAPK
ncbi:MAG TPA: hypothetical protein VFA04_10275 [Bryobacteraceae bacterium]|nr:hypothetical protein [Bryobacteraceae bacterium]